jgi:hypothetical protein
LIDIPVDTDYIDVDMNVHNSSEVEAAGSCGNEYCKQYQGGIMWPTAADLYDGNK